MTRPLHLLSLILGLAIGLAISATAGSVSFTVPVESTYHPIAAVDGDTLKVEAFSDSQLLYWSLRHSENIRLLCIDSPERGDAGYKEAGAWLEKQTAGAVVELQAGENTPRRDTFGRALAYVIVGGRNVNLEEVRAGLAPIARDYPCPMQESFEAAEAEARAAKRGLWK